jgi:predicted transport protein
LRKLSIAYKAETNFVDIVPQAKRLRLSLNMPFAELDDPRGLAKNVAGLGRWGNGEVELRVNALEEVPYAIGLIRQSLDRQLDDAPEAP